MSDLEPRKPHQPMDFGSAVGGAFQTSGGREYFLRLWFWMAAFMSVVLIIGVPFILPFYGDILEINWQNMQALMDGTTPDSNDELFSSFGKMMPFYIPFMLATWAVMAAGETALYKKYFHNYEAPRQPLRFGGAELRTMMVQLGVYCCVFLAYFLGALCVGMLAGLLGVFSPVLALIIAIPGIFIVICLLPYVAVRLAPASALTVERDTAHVLGANKITKYRFWWMFLAYLVSYVGGYILFYIVYIIALMIATGNPDIMLIMTGMGEESPRQAVEAIMERLKRPIPMFLGVLAMIITAATAAAWILCVAGVNAYAVGGKAMTGQAHLIRM